MTRHDDDLRRAFRALRDDDARRAPPFAVPTRTRRWRPRLAVMAAATTAVAATCLLVFWPRHAPKDDPLPATISLEHLSQVIEREVFVATATDWQSPTDFLLQPEPLTDEND